MTTTTRATLDNGTEVITRRLGKYEQDYCPVCDKRCGTAYGEMNTRGGFSGWRISCGLEHYAQHIYGWSRQQLLTSTAEDRGE